MRILRLPFAMLLAATVGCSFGGDESGADAGVRADSGPDFPDAGDGDGDGDNGPWQVEQVTKLPDSATYEGVLAFDDAGTLWMAFSSTEFDTSSNQDIYTTRREGGVWSEPEARHMPSDYQFTYPTLVADGAQLHLLMSGRFEAEAANNVYYTGYAGGSWSAASAVTAGVPGEGLGYYHPVAARGGDTTAVAYVFAGDVTRQSPEVWVGNLEAGAIVGAVLAIPGAGDGCYDPAIAVDAAGVRHVVAACGGVGSLQIHYTNDAGGSFAAPEIVDEGQTFNSTPNLAVDADGQTLHLAWQRLVGCPTGTCSSVLYTTRSGGTWNPPVDVDGGSPTAEITPTLTVAADGTRYIAFQRRDADNDADIYVATSTDGISFDERRIMPGTGNVHQIAPRSLLIDPATGAVHFTFQDTTALDPYNTEIWHAWLDPTAQQ